MGPMFAGKSSELLRRVAVCEAAGLSVAVVKSCVDDRYSDVHVVTHDGLKKVGCAPSSVWFVGGGRRVGGCAWDNRAHAWTLPQQKHGSSVPGMHAGVPVQPRTAMAHAASLPRHAMQQPCYAVPTLAAFRERAGERWAGYQVIAVDEAQFFPDLLDVCPATADHEGKHWILAGLDGDFRRRRFGLVRVGGGVPWLVPGRGGWVCGLAPRKGRGGA